MPDEQVTLVPGPWPGPASSIRILDLARDAGRFTTFLRAVGVAGLADLLEGPGPFTVFAPVDAAFNELPDGTIDELLSSRPKLAITLTNHLIEGRLTLRDIRRLDLARPQTVSGRHLRISCDDGSIWVNHAKLIEPSLHAANGVVHGVDRVFVPGPALSTSSGRFF